METNLNLLEMAVQRHESELDRLKTEQADFRTIQTHMQADIANLKTITQLHDRSLTELREDLKEIKDDTKWLRRTITKSVIGAVVSGIVVLIGMGVLWIVNQNL